jgi:protein-tyrosine phosphatase
LSDASLRPIFVHCLLGKDRTAFILGLYRVYYEDWPPEAAWAEMLRSGFHVRSTLRGFQTYF